MKSPYPNTKFFGIGIKLFFDMFIILLEFSLISSESLFRGSKMLFTVYKLMSVFHFLRKGNFYFFSGIPHHVIIRATKIKTPKWWESCSFQVLYSSSRLNERSICVFVSIKFTWRCFFLDADNGMCFA